MTGTSDEEEYAQNQPRAFPNAITFIRNEGGTELSGGASGCGGGSPLKGFSSLLHDQLV